MQWLLFLSYLGLCQAITISLQEKSNFYERYQCSTEISSLKQQFGDCITDLCGRRVIDDAFSMDDIDSLHEIVKKGMSRRESIGGPTILDINTGYIRDSAGLENLFMNKDTIYTTEEFQRYGQIINQLKLLVMETFQLQDLYFTAPTFITRLDGRQDWEPQGIHDEYWHSHSDHINTPHYHYSGLLYLSDYEKDFTGGRLVFPELEVQDSQEDQGQPDKQQNRQEVVLEPRKGRVVIFTSGPENPHWVERLESGQRFVLSFWFTCDPRKSFEIYLDGAAHVAFANRLGEKLKARSPRKEEL